MSQCTDEKSNKSVEDMDRTFAGWQSMVQRSQICTKSYKIRNTITNFQKLNFKNKSFYSLYSIVKVGVQGLLLESLILQSLEKPNFHNQICFKISKSVPYYVGFQTMQIQDLQTMLCHPVKVLSLSSTLLFDCSSVHCDALFKLLSRKSHLYNCSNTRIN